MISPELTIERQQPQRRWESWPEGVQAAGDVLSASHDQMTSAMSARAFQKLREDGRSKFQFEQKLKHGVGYDLRDRRDPRQMVSEFMTMVNGLREEVGDDSYGFMQDEEDRRRTIDEARAVRRGDIAAAKYLFLKEWRRYITNLRGAASDENQQSYCNAWNQVIEEAVKQLMTEECAIVNLDVMRHIRRVGQLIDREGNEPITEEQLVYVRALTSHLPALTDGTLQLTTPYKAGVGNRNSIHGALNHYVEGHAKGSWHDVSSVVIAPFRELMSQKQPTALNEIDTFFFGEVELNLPEGSVVVINEGDEQWIAFLNEHPELEERYTIIRVTDPQAVRAASTVAMLRMGYSVIPGGDSSSADRSVSRRVTQLAQERQITEGGIPHFYSQSDVIDMMHGAILLDRAKKEHSGDDWVGQVDWTGEHNMVRAQLAELLNSLRPFFHVILETDFTKFNLPEDRKRELINALVHLIQDAEAVNATDTQERAAGEAENQREWARRDLRQIASGIKASYQRLDANQKVALAAIAPEAAAFLESAAVSFE